jgi:lipid A oxidase
MDFLSCLKMSNKFVSFGTSLGLSLAVFAGFGGILNIDTAQAEATFSLYGGHNSSPHSKVEYDLNLGAGPQNVTVGWDGKSFEMPPYYGVRATWWMDTNPQFGFAIDFSHSKVYASPLPAGLSILEFTDGINILTANALYRYQNESRFTPYGGVGIGASIPSVELANVANTSKTKEYQLGGVAVQGFIGVDVAINENWSIFGELKSAYTMIDGDLSGGGSVSTNLISNQIIVGVSYRFF